MDPKNKSIALLVFTMLFIVTYVTSYLGSSGLSANSSSATTTIRDVKTYFVSGNSVAVVVGYQQTAAVRLSNLSSAADSATVSNTLNDLESNGSVQSYVPSGQNSYQVFLGSMDPYSLKQAIDSSLGSNAIAAVRSTALINLPTVLTMYHDTTPVSITVPEKNYTVALPVPVRRNSTINVTLSALVTYTGSIYNGQLRINYTT